MIYTPGQFHCTQFVHKTEHLPSFAAATTGVHVIRTWGITAAPQSCSVPYYEPSGTLTTPWTIGVAFPTLQTKKVRFTEARSPSRSQLASPGLLIQVQHFPLAPRHCPHFSSNSDLVFHRVCLIKVSVVETSHSPKGYLGANKLCNIFSKRNFSGFHRDEGISDIYKLLWVWAEFIPWQFGSWTQLGKAQERAAMKGTEWWRWSKK